jgi:hypothetical protein
MAAARALVECYLAGRVQGTVEAIHFPHDPDPEGYGLDQFGDQDVALMPEQTAAALAALHDVYCAGVERVIPLPAELPALGEAAGEARRHDWPRALSWEATLGRVRDLGEYARPWFALQLRHFEERILPSAGADRQQEERRPAEPDAPLPAVLSAPDLARWFNLPVPRVESALRRFRADHPDCFHEVEDRRQNEPRYLYRTADVLSVLQRLREGA